MPETNESMNVVDLLKKGNLELFHSSMIAWLLNPNEESHGFGDTFLKNFLIKARLDEFAKLALKDTTVVETETFGIGGRYDIVLNLRGHEIIIENKTKSIGSTSQLAKYWTESRTIIPLGFTEFSFNRNNFTSDPKERDLLDAAFSHEVRYCDILAILDNISAKSTEFDVLIRHYREFLRRELGLLTAVDRCYLHGEYSSNSELLAIALQNKRYNQNDRRFVDLYFLQQFRRYVDEANREGLAGITRWESNKNMIGGVWMAGTLPELQLIQELRPDKLLESGGSAWFHIEINSGLLQSDESSPAAQIQFRIGVEKNRNAGELYTYLSSVRDLQIKRHPEMTGLEFRKPMAKPKATFYLFRQFLSRRELVFETLLNRVDAFCKLFT